MRTNNKSPQQEQQSGGYQMGPMSMSSTTNISNYTVQNLPAPPPPPPPRLIGSGAQVNHDQWDMQHGRFLQF